MTSRAYSGRLHAAVWVVAALAFFAGCGEALVVQVQAIDSHLRLRAVPEKQVKLYAGEPPRPPALVLGSVAIDVVGDGDDAAAEARRAFGAIGADAIIHVRLTKLTGYVVRTGLAGLAVRMTP